MTRSSLSHRIPCIATIAILIGGSITRAEGPRYERRWFYSMHNLQVEAQADDLIALIKQAGDAGYNGVVVADYKLNLLDRVPEHYFQHMARVRDAAAQAKVEIIPSIFPIGYSNALLAHDPNLAEGMPVEGAPFVVQGGKVVPVPDENARIANGGLEEATKHVFAGFRFQDDPGMRTIADREVAHLGHVSCRIQDGGSSSSAENARLIYHMPVRPHACYRFSAWVKTKALSHPSAFRLLALGADEGSRPLTFHEGGIEATQDWRPVEVVFNSQNQTEINLYVGLWGRDSGTLWIDDLAFEELSLVNVLRRDGCPLTIQSADGAITYTEGRDVEPIIDSKLGRVPYDGEYEFAHAAPTIQLARDSRLVEGQRLKLGWHHPVITHGFQVMCCLTDPKVDALLRDQAKRVNELLHPHTYFMAHDEIRVANWCESCRATGKTPGQLLAAQASRCVNILREVNPQAQVVVWSDMFDPNHNAVNEYYLVNGTLAGSWEGLDSGVTIANWNSGKARESLLFFAQRGHGQILAGYYDDSGLDNFRRWDSAAQGVERIDGFLYTTWERKYGLLAEYGAAMRRAR